jgi:hypothetical protein
MQYRRPAIVARLIVVLIGTVLDLAGRAVAAPTVYHFVDLTPTGVSDGIALGVRGAAHQVGLGHSPATGGAYHALLWNGTAAGAVDLHPAGFNQSQAHATAGDLQVGVGFNGPSSALRTTALLWRGSAASVVNLHPGSQWRDSGINDTDGVRHFGHGLLESPREYHALLWTDVSPTPVDFHPPGYAFTLGTGIGDGQLVGTGIRPETNQRALLWNGTPAALVDLHPDGMFMSIARDVANGQHVGEVFPTPSTFHAALWRGSAASFVDLHPAGFDGSVVERTNGQMQVGYAYLGDVLHAMAWSGTAASALDLHAFVPAPFTHSEARGIDAFGNIVGAAYTDSGQRHAVMWVVPEPTALVCALPLVVTMSRRWRP